MRLCECGNELESDLDDVCLQCYEKMEAGEDEFRPLNFNDKGYVEEIEWEEDDERL